MEHRLELETALLAKELGFNDECSHVFREENRKIEELQYFESNRTNKEIEENSGYSSTLSICTAPTQTELQKWLRETHNIFVNVFLDRGDKYKEPFYPYDSFSQKEVFFAPHINYKGEGKWIEDLDRDDSSSWKAFYDVWEEAMEVGLLQALMLLQKGYTPFGDE